MSTHVICFYGEIRKIINTFWLKKKCLTWSYGVYTGCLDIALHIIRKVLANNIGCDLCA